MMSWIKLDDQWMDHPKIVRAGRDARDVWLASITWCAKHLTDGYFPKELLPSLAVSAGVDVANCQTFASTLLHVGLWELRDDQYYIHDYLDYNPTREQANATKAARSEAGRAGGLAKAGKMPSKIVAKDKQKSAPSPSPSHTESNTVVVDEPPGWATDPTIGGKPPITTTFASESIAQGLLMKIAKVAFIPGGQRDKIEAVHSMIDVYGLEKTETALGAAFQKWVTTKKKTGGGTYSALNLGWVDWAQESLLNIAPPEDNYYDGWEIHQ